MKSSKPLTTISLASLLACLGAVACSGAEVAQDEQAQSASLSRDTAAAPTPETMRPEHRHGSGLDGRGRHHGPPRPEKMIERFDENKNGTLEASELPDKMQEHIGDIDTSGDGVVTKDELAAHMKQRFIEHAKRRFERKDANKDGVLDEAELGERWSQLSVADENADKRLTPEELRAAFEAGKLAPMRGGHGKHGKGDAPAAPQP